MTDANPQDKEIEEGRPFAFLSYLWILCLIPLFLKRDNRFAIFHGRQGLVLFIGEVLISILGMMPVVGWVVFFAGSALFGILSLIGLFQVLRGNYWRMPVINGMAEKIGL